MCAVYETIAVFAIDNKDLSFYGSDVIHYTSGHSNRTPPHPTGNRGVATGVALVCLCETVKIRET